MTEKTKVKTDNHKVNFAKRKYFRMLKLDERKNVAAFNPHRHTFFELFFFTKGGGEHLVDFPVREFYANLIARARFKLRQQLCVHTLLTTRHWPSVERPLCETMPRKRSQNKSAEST